MKQSFSRSAANSTYIRRAKPRSAMLATDIAPRRWLGVLGGGIFVGLWYFAALYIGDTATLATPGAVVESFVRLMHEPFAGSTLEGHMLASLWRFTAGFALSILVGIPLGLTLGLFQYMEAMIKPIFNILRFIAPIAWVPFAVLWFGTGLGGPVLIIFAGAFPACVIGAYGGAKLVDYRLLEAARMLGAKHLRILLSVIFPSAVPSIVSALRVAAGNAWQSLVGAELIVASSGIAYVMVRGQMNRTIVIVLTGMLAIGLVGLLLDWLFGCFERFIQRRLGAAAS